MNLKYLLNALAFALIAAAESFKASAAELPEEIVGTLSVTGTTIAPDAIADVILDSDGLPWDERIHAGTKTQTQKGAWTQKKGVDAAVRDAVTAELRKLYPAPVAAAAVTAIPAPATGATGPALPTLALPVATAVTPYTQLVDWLAKNSGEGKALTAAWITAAFEANSCTLAELAAVENHKRAADFLDAFKGALASMGVAEVI